MGALKRRICRLAPALVPGETGKRRQRQEGTSALDSAFGCVTRAMPEKVPLGTFLPRAKWFRLVSMGSPFETRRERGGDVSGRGEASQRRVGRSRLRLSTRKGGGPGGAQPQEAISIDRRNAAQAIGPIPRRHRPASSRGALAEVVSFPSGHTTPLSPAALVLILEFPRREGGLPTFLLQVVP